MFCKKKKRKPKTKKRQQQRPPLSFSLSKKRKTTNETKKKTRAIEIGLQDSELLSLKVSPIIFTALLSRAFALCFLGGGGEAAKLLGGFGLGFGGFWEVGGYVFWESHGFPLCVFSYFFYGFC